MNSGISREYELVLQELRSTREAQIRSAERIVVSQEGAADEIASLRRDLASESADVSSSLGDLAATFEWGLTELIWHAQQQTALLRQLSDQLAAPLDMQAKELRKRAEYAYGQRWYEEALEDFLVAAEKNPYDFIVQHYIGNILLFHKEDPDGSVEYFERAAKFALPRAPMCAAFSLLHAGEARRRQGRFEDAYEIIRRATLTPTAPPESFYQLSRICAATARYDEAERSLHEAIRRDRLYCAKCSFDQAFESMRARVTSLLQQIEEGVSAAALSAVEQVEGLRQSVAQEVIPFLRRHGMSSRELRSHLENRSLEEARALITKESILEGWRALGLAETFRGLIAAKLQEYPWQEEVDRVQNEQYSVWDNRNFNQSALVGAGSGALLAFVISKLLMPSFPYLAGGSMFLFTLSLVFFWVATGFLVGWVSRTITYKIDWMGNIAPQLRRRRRTAMKYASEAAARETRHTAWHEVA